MFLLVMYAFQVRVREFSTIEKVRECADTWLKELKREWPKTEFSPKFVVYKVEKVEMEFCGSP